MLNDEPDQTGFHHSEFNSRKIASGMTRVVFIWKTIR